MCLPSPSSLRDATLPLLSLRDIFPRSGGSLSSKGEARALPETFSFNLKLQQQALDLGSPSGRAGAGAPERAGLFSLLPLLLLHGGALVHMIQLYGGSLCIGAGHVRGDNAIAVQVLPGNSFQHRLGLRV